MALTYQQSKLVKDTIPALRERGEQITTTFYRNMLRDHPELNNVFNSVNQKNGRQPRALTSVILNFASNINHISELIPKFERMCNKHCSLGIRPEHYEIVGKYLLRAFGEVLGPAMTPAVFAAWEKAYWLLAKMLIGRESQLYKDFDKWTGWRQFKIDRVVPESEDIYSFYLVPQDGKKLPKFFPGQYVSLRIPGPEGFMQARQYSLSEAWREDYYRISVKRDGGARYENSVSTSYFHPGLVSNMLIDHMPAGSTVELSHPAGEFFLDVNNTGTTPLVLISAGVGVTPMVAIANTVTKTQPGRPISWIHGSRRSVPFEQHIAQLKRDNPNFRTNIFKTQLASCDVVGVTYNYDFRMDLAKVDPEDLHLQSGGTEYYICGPEQFMLEMKDYLKAQGVGASRVKFELFSTGDLAFKYQ
ncbi:putative flavohemo protein [Achaetomium macrosporum]|uniref:nitric oxide dioxygenase n=1 Tax=Achaetomium macrosporum TaxID=79813 RepID=A0AAN7CIJ3_9PEZI|nr:putative flavohemo protein [Achaetomium macrosporum]